MKKLVTVFPRRVYVNNTGGTALAYAHDPALIPTIGEAVDVSWQVVVYNRSAGAKLTLQPFQGSDPDARPATPLGGVPLTAQTLNAPINLGSQAPLMSAAPLLGRMESTLVVESGPGGTFESVDCAVFATLTYR